MGAAADQPGRDAGHAAAVHRDRVPVHLLGAGAPGGDRARLPLPGAQRHGPVRGARPVARHGRGAGHRAGRQEGRRRRGHRRADVHDLGGARRRVLRGHRRRLPRLPGHRPRLHQGPGGHPHPGPGADADPRRPGGARRQAARAALARHARAVPAHLPRRGRARRARAPGRVRRTRQRQLAARRRAAGRQPARQRAHRRTSTTGCSPPSPGTSTGSRRPRGCRREDRAPSTRRSWTTSSPAGSCRRPGGSCAEIGLADRFDALMARDRPGPRRARLPDHGHARTRRW